MENTVVTVIALIAGGISAVTGFGIGSLLTPVLALRVDTGLAVAVVSIPHVIGTALRFSLLKGGIDRAVLWSFGLTSVAAGLAGAVLQSWATNRWLNLLMGSLLMFAAASEFSGLARRMRFHGAVAWVAGAISGLLGGLVGNQGGIRSAALLGFGLSKETLVATATAIALFVDGSRMPVYLSTRYQEIAALWWWTTLATVGVIVGTVVGSRVLTVIPEVWFRRVLALALTALGIVMLVRGFRG